MTDVTAAVLQEFPRVTPRPSGDCPAVNVPASDALALLRQLRDRHGFDILTDITAIDWTAAKSPRFTVVWHLYSSTAHRYIRIAADCPDAAAPAMPSACALWPAANWHEREAWDMFGIRFPGHPDLRRILMWEGYPYFPLRKEFPLAGLPADLPDADIAGETRVCVQPAPMAGGPFVATPGEPMSEAEPRARDESWNEQHPKPE